MAPGISENTSSGDAAFCRVYFHARVLGVLGGVYVYDPHELVTDSAANITNGSLFPCDENLHGYIYSEGLLSLGIMDPMLRSNVMVPSVNRLLKTKVPTVKQITVVDGPAEDSPCL